MQLKQKNIYTHNCKSAAVMLLLFLSSVCYSLPQSVRDELLLEAQKAIDSADVFMGDWYGSRRKADGSDIGSLSAQVISLGKGEYRANLIEEFNKRSEPIAVLKGRVRKSSVHFTGRSSYHGADIQIQAVIKNGRFTGSFTGKDKNGQDINGSFVMKKVYRISHTLGEKPPAEAIVLFDGRSLEHWKPVNLKGPRRKKVRWKLIDGAMQVVPDSGSIITKRKFRDFKLHLEFRTPFMPAARGQKRGNSGVYLQGRYEIQVLDSYGLEGRDNECGGIYKIGAPKVNMCAPPAQWQSYDVTFRAPRFYAAGNKIHDARVTVVHNGVTIHDNLKIPKPTGEAIDNNTAKPGGIYLQDHADKVQYRNIWLVELPPEPNSP